MNPLGQRFLDMLLGLLRSELARGPWRCRSFLATFCVGVVGSGLWFSDVLRDAPADSHESPDPSITAADGAPAASLPNYLRVCISYAGGFLIGWAFRSVIKIVVVATALIVSLVGFGKYAGWDTDPLKTRIEQNATAVRERAERTRDRLQSMLPSGAAGGLGAVFGWRRRARSLPAGPGSPDA